MRVNIESSVITDPRFKLLAKKLSISQREVIGTCFMVWLACYERRNERLSVAEANAAADVEGFSEALAEVGLADLSDDGRFIDVHGVTDRIRFLRDQKERGKLGGRARLFEEPADEPQDPPPAPEPVPVVAPSKAPPIALPFASEAFRAAWEKWAQHRAEKRAKLTPTTIRAQLKKLETMGEERALAALEHSTTQGYQGIFEPNGGSNGQQGRASGPGVGQGSRIMPAPGKYDGIGTSSSNGDVCAPKAVAGRAGSADGGPPAH